MNIITAIQIHENDNVATVTKKAECGDAIRLNGVEFTTTGSPIYHKIAIVAIAQGEAIVKYGEVIGHASGDIARGTHVHVSNLTPLALH